MAASVYRARWLIGRGWRAGLALALVTGLVAGLVGAAWAAGRRGEDAYGRFVDHVGAPRYAGFFCDPAHPLVPNGAFPRCGTDYDPKAEVAFLRGLPGVVSVTKTRFIPVEITVDGQTFSAAISVSYDGPVVNSAGNPIVVSGHLPQQPDQLFVNEVGARFPLGTPVTIRPTSVETGKPLDLPAQTLHLVGVGRFPVDLAVQENKLEQATGIAFVAPSWWDEWGSKVESSGAGVLVQLRPGVAGESIRAAVAARWPGRYVYDLPTRDAKEGTVRNAIGYESNALVAVAVCLAVAMFVFVGQALARQTRREQPDLDTLAALGMRKSQTAAASALRAATVGTSAGILAAAIVWISSRWTPVGLAANAEPSPGLRADPFVMATVALATTAFVIAAMTLPVVARRRSTTARRALATRVANAWHLPPAGVAGMGMVTPHRSRSVAAGTAVAGITFATCVAVAAWSAAASLDSVLHDPASYGARWDALVSSNSSGVDLVGLLPKLHGVTEAAGMYQLDGLVDGKPYPIVAMQGLGGTSPAAWSTIVAGRPPERDGEVALGATAMRELHASTGSEVTLQVSAEAKPQRLTVVGQAVFNDSQDLEAGLGALVTENFFRTQAEVTKPSSLLIRLRPGTNADQALAPFAAVGASWFAPTPPATVRNLRRVKALPWLLAVIITALSAGALAHALVVSVRSHRRELGVLRALGFTPYQNRATVGWQALCLAAAGIAIGVPAGIVVGRWGWTLLANQIGIPARPDLPPIVIPIVVATMTVLAMAMALWPSQRAARVQPALALRAE